MQRNRGVGEPFIPPSSDSELPYQDQIIQQNTQ